MRGWIVPLLGLLAACSSASSAATAAAADVTGFAHLSVELREHIFDLLDIEDYFGFLGGPPDLQRLRGTAEFELGLLGRLARQVKGLSSIFGTSERRLEDIFNDVQRFLGLFYGLPATYAGEDVAMLKKRALDFEQIYSECAALSKVKPWHFVCFAALIKENNFSLLYPHLSPDFCTRNRETMEVAAAMNGDYLTLKCLLDSTHQTWRSMSSQIAYGIAYSGSTKLLEAIERDLGAPELNNDALCFHLISLGRSELFRRVLERLRTTREVLRMSPSISSIVPNAIRHRRFEMIRDFADVFPRLFQTITIKSWLCALVRADDLPALKMILWDEREHCRRRNKHTDEDDFTLEMVRVAARNNRVRVLRFLLFDYCPRRLISNGNMQRILRGAAAKGHMAVLDLLLGRWPDGAFLINGIDFETEPSLVLVGIAQQGQLGVLNYFLARKEQGDERFARFSLAASSNILLRTACALAQVELVRFLLAHEEVDPSVPKHQSLLNAINHGSLEIVQELLKLDDEGGLVHATIDLAEKGQYPLVFAANHGRWEIVEFLLQVRRNEDGGAYVYVFPGIDVNARNGRVLAAAIEAHNDAIIRLLLRRDDDDRFVLPGLQIPEALVSKLEDRQYRVRPA